MSRYTVYITPRALRELKDLRGHMRQRVKRAISDLKDEPRPTTSKQLTTSEFEHELRRLRLDKWRVVYTIVESDSAVDVLAIRKRPPYDYGDLEKILSQG